MSKKSILLATVTTNGSIYTAYNISVLQLEKACTRLGIDLVNACTQNEYSLQKAKNILFSMFMKTPHTHLLLIDADIEFEADDVIKMLEFDKPVIGGLNYKTNIRWDKLAEIANQKGEKNYSIETLQTISREYNFVPRDGDMQTFDVSKEFIEVDVIGSSVMLLKREALEQIEAAYANDKYVVDGNPCFPYFNTDIKTIPDSGTSIYIEDDQMFCNRWRQLGGKVYLHTKFRCKHWGTYTF